MHAKPFAFDAFIVAEQALMGVEKTVAVRQAKRDIRKLQLALHRLTAAGEKLNESVEKGRQLQASIDEAPSAACTADLLSLMDAMDDVGNTYLSIFRNVRELMTAEYAPAMQDVRRWAKRLGFRLPDDRGVLSDFANLEIAAAEIEKGIAEGPTLRQATLAGIEDDWERALLSDRVARNKVLAARDRAKRGPVSTFVPLDAE